MTRTTQHLLPAGRSTVDGVEGELRAEALAVTYPNGTRALQHTTLSFRRGEFTVLLGSSGAGKSTLLRCLNGMVRPSAGQVLSPGLGTSPTRRHCAATVARPAWCSSTTT